MLSASTELQEQPFNTGSGGRGRENLGDWNFLGTKEGELNFFSDPEGLNLFHVSSLANFLINVFKRLFS